MQYLIHGIQCSCRPTIKSYNTAWFFMLCLLIISKQLSYLLNTVSVTFIKQHRWLYFTRMASNLYSNCAKLASDVANSANGDVRNGGPLYLHTVLNFAHPLSKFCLTPWSLLVGTGYVRDTYTLYILQTHWEACTFFTKNFYIKLPSLFHLKAFFFLPCRFLSKLCRNYRSFFHWW